MESISFRAMGCQMLALLEAERPGAREILAEVPGWFTAWERALSRFRPESELSRLNRGSHTSGTPVSETLWDALAAALEAARESESLVTPLVLLALERAGYDRDFGALASEAGPALPRSTAVLDWRVIQVDPGRRRVVLPRGARLDLGGSAKSWAAERATRQLAAHGPALVDAGGDIAVSGPRADGSPWPVGVADPHKPGAELDLLLLYAGGVATSGRDVRRWQRGGVEQHHLIDPRTGRPAVTDLLAVTVVAPGVQEAEMAAKVVMLLGQKAGLRWLATRPHLAALLVTEAGGVVRTPSLEQYRWREPAEVGA